LIYDIWPPLSVRDWQTVLALRDPEWGSEEGDRDGFLAADDSRRIHELRGVIIGQVAEIENLLLHICTQVGERSSLEGVRYRRARRPAGAILTEVERILKILGLDHTLEEEIRIVRETISKRNAIVHAVVDVGYSYIKFNDSRGAVIIILRDNDKDRWRQRLEEAAQFDPWTSDEMDPLDISEVDLERQLAQAYEALDKCVDIWIEVNEILPDPPSALDPWA
jgi:hypothetical protein